MHWARFYLSKAGLLDSSKRGVWALSEKGKAELVDGEKLVDMLEQLELGLKSRTTYKVDTAFFESFNLP